MEQKEITVVGRDDLGSGGTNRLRRSGFIPGVVYGEGADATPFAISEYDYTHRVSGSNAGQIFILKSERKELNKRLTLIRDLQIEPLKQRVMHIDLLQIQRDHKIRVTVPVRLVGESPAIKTGDGVLSQLIQEVEIECLPDAIPPAIELDTSELDVGNALHVSNLQLPPGVELRTDGQVTVVSAVAKQAVDTATLKEEEEAAAEEGEEKKAEDGEGGESAGDGGGS